MVAAAARPTMGLCADTSKKAALAARKTKLQGATAGAAVRSTASALPDADLCIWLAPGMSATAPCSAPLPSLVCPADDAGAETCLSSRSRLASCCPPSQSPSRHEPRGAGQSNSRERGGRRRRAATERGCACLRRPDLRRRVSGGFIRQ